MELTYEDLVILMSEYMYENDTENEARIQAMMDELNKEEELQCTKE